MLDNLILLTYVDPEAVVQRCCKNGILKTLAKSTEKLLCQSLFFNKVAGLCFSINFVEFLRTPFL